jgi:AcrR family transcriptional regulator
MVDALVEATARVLRTEGAEAVSTNRVAQVAGVSVGSLYQYFPGKDALIYAVLERQERRQLALLGDAIDLAPGEPLTDLVRGVVSALVRFYRDDPGLARVLGEQRRRLIAIRPLPELEQAFHLVVVKALEARSGELRAMPVEIAAFVIQRAVDALSFEAVLRRPEFLGDPTFVEEIVQLIVRYVGAGEA